MNLQTFKFWMQASLPFGLTLAAISTILIVGINGIVGNFFGAIFTLDVKNLAIPPSTITELTTADIPDGANITATSLGLADKYAFYLWSYASTRAGRTTYSGIHFDYLSKVLSSKLTIDGVSKPLLQEISSKTSSLAIAIMIAQITFLFATFHAFLELAIGIAACFGRKYRLAVISILSGITLATIVAFAAIITSMVVGLMGVSKGSTAFGLKAEAGTSDLVSVWLAVVHMLAVCIMWASMAFGIMKMNPAVKTLPKVTEEEQQELVQIPKTGRYFKV